MADRKCCLGCLERHYLCHSTCERHKVSKAERAAEKAAIKAKLDEERKLDHQAFIARAKARKEKPHRG